MSKKRLVTIIIILAVGIVIYANSFHNDFLWDDEFLIVNNIFIKNWNFLAKIFVTDIFAGSGGSSNFYRPIQSLTLLADYNLWRLNPFGYHLTNTLIHIANAILVYWLLIILSGNSMASIFSALFFLTHPIQTEAVTYISGRADPLMGLFLLLGFILFIKWDKSSVPRRNLMYIASLACFLSALLSKEAGLIFPFLLLAYRVIFYTPRPQSSKTQTALPLIPFFIIFAIYSLVRLHTLDLTQEDIYASKLFPLSARVLFSGTAFLNYLRLLVFPAGLHMEQTLKITGPSLKPDMWISLIFLIGVIALIIKLRRSSKLVSFGLLWFIISLLPTANIFLLNAFIAEHWLYFPSIGVFAAISGWLVQGINIKYQKIVVTCFTLILITAGILTIKQNGYWKNGQTLNQHILKFDPSNVRACYGLGNIYYNNKLYQEAQEQYEKVEEQYKKALSINPNYYRAHNDLGIIYTRIGKSGQAIEELEKAISLRPDFPEAYYNLGLIYDEKGTFEKAVECYKRVIALNPYHPITHYNLGVIYDKQGLVDEAMSEYKKVITINPEYVDAYNNLGVLYAQKREYGQAEKYWQAALKINPNDAEAFKNISALKKYPHGHK